MANEHQSLLGVGLQMKPEESTGNNAPIEIKQKSCEATSNVAMHIEVESKKDDDKERERENIEKRKKQVQQCAVRLFKQIKTGCNKDICFNKYCRKNPYCREELAEFKDDKSILLHLTKTLFKTRDPETLMCSNTVSLNASNLDETPDVVL